MRAQRGACLAEGTVRTPAPRSESATMPRTLAETEDRHDRRCGLRKKRSRDGRASAWLRAKRRLGLPSPPQRATTRARPPCVSE